MGVINIGIVGVGAIAQDAHLPSYAKRHDVEIRAFADPETDRVSEFAERFARDKGRPAPRVYASIEEMAADQGGQLDAVSICTPNGTHVSLALQALSAGWHVLLEKPMGTRVDEAERLVEEVRASGKQLMVGMSHRYREDVEVLRRFVQSGELGDIYFAKTRILRRRGTPKGWFTDLAQSGGGPLMDIGVHALDLTWWLTGALQPKSVSGFLRRGIGQDHLDFIRTWAAKSAGNERNEVYTTEDFAAGFFRFAGGMGMEMEVSWALNGPEDDALKVEIFGTKGGVSLDPLRVYSTAHGVLTTTTPSVGMGAFFDREINHFLHCVKTGSEPVSTAEQGRDIVRMLAALGESSERGCEVTF